MGLQEAKQLQLTIGRELCLDAMEIGLPPPFPTAGEWELIGIVEYNRQHYSTVYQHF